MPTVFLDSLRPLAQCVECNECRQAPAKPRLILSSPFRVRGRCQKIPRGHGVPWRR